MLFRELVRRRLKEKNLTVLDLSDLTGLSMPYLYDLLRGRRRWNEDTIAKVCEALGIDLICMPEEEAQALCHAPAVSFAVPEAGPSSPAARNEAQAK